MGVRKFTVRPKIKPEESFSSYMVRIGSMNFIRYEEIYRTIKTGSFKNFDQRYNYYLDAMPSYILDMSKLTTLLQLQKSDIEAHSFVPIYKKIMDECNEKSHSKLGVTQFINQKTRSFCPECIKDGIFKLHWQINDIVVCEIHNIRLQTKCDFCDLEQPYLNRDTLIKGICFNCGHQLKKNHVNKVADSKYIEKQKILISNYQFLINPNNILVNNISGLDRERSLAITLLYIMNGEKREFERNNIQSSYSDRAVRRIVEIARGIKSDGNLTISKFFEIFNELDIDISYISKIHVPNQFVKSLYHYYVIISDTAGYCMSPWCKSYGANSSMEKVKRSKYFRGRNEYLKTFVCTSCYMKYGYRKNDAQWVAADNKIDRIKEFIQYYPKETMIKKNREHFKISLEAFYDLLGYSCIYKLLPRELIDTNSFVYSKKHILAEFEQLVQSGGQLFKQAQKNYRWTIGEFYYYLNLPEIQNYIHLDAYKENLVDKTAELEEKVGSELSNCLENNVEITVNYVASKLKTTKKTLKKYGLSEKIMKVAEQQKTTKQKQEKRVLYEKVKEFCNQKIKDNTPVLSKELYQYLGCSHTYLMNNHPDLYKYIIKQVAVDRERIRQIKLEQYKQDLKDAIIEIIHQKKLALNQKNILEKANLTDNVYSHYPELKDFIYEYLYQKV